MFLSFFLSTRPRRRHRSPTRSFVRSFVRLKIKSKSIQISSARLAPVSRVEKRRDVRRTDAVSPCVRTRSRSLRVSRPVPPVETRRPTRRRRVVVAPSSLQRPRVAFSRHDPRRRCPPSLDDVDDDDDEHDDDVDDSPTFEISTLYEHSVQCEEMKKKKTAPFTDSTSPDPDLTRLERVPVGRSVGRVRVRVRVRFRFRVGNGKNGKNRKNGKGAAPCASTSEDG